MRVSDYESRWATYWPEGKTIYDVAVCLEEENALQAAEIERLNIGNTALLESLMDMVNQHCKGKGGEINHMCLSANEDAISILEDAGMITDGKLDWDALKEKGTK